MSLLISTAFLIWAFAIEPAQGFQLVMWRSRAGLYTLLLGCSAHAVSSMRAPEK